MLMIILMKMLLGPKMSSYGNVYCKINFLFSWQVTRVMLLWVNNHYNDFEGDLMMDDYLEAFENGLEQQVYTSVVCLFWLVNLVY